jgi:N utilization substance protein B
MSRKSARETAMKLIYQIDINDCESGEVLSSFYENNEDELNDEEKEYIEGCVKGVKENLSLIDNYIEKYLKGWKINRIARVELAIMRLSVYEMIAREDVPDIVAVNEAVELARTYGGENSTQFVNGVLGNLIKEFEKDGKNPRD